MTVADFKTNTTRPNFEVKPGKLFIDGEFRDGGNGNKMDVVDPTTEEVLTQVVEGNEEDTVAAIEAARRAFEGDWRKMSGFGRELGKESLQYYLQNKTVWIDMN